MRLRCFSGSSPRTRGTRGSILAHELVDRFIPAHAGNTRKEASGGSSCTVHPRARGEHSTASFSIAVNDGSSPRTRGTLGHWRATPTGCRFIPAHAGNTLNPRLFGGKLPVHPRARGEHANHSAHWAHSHGTSPRTRGTLHWTVEGQRGGRFIPAHAGNTSSCCISICYCPVHPRARGEHTSSLTRQTSLTGSSPRHAGNTIAGPSTAARCTVHPRARGEHFSIRAVSRSMSGSSPRTRGTLIDEHAMAGGVRFIPAHAGNTAKEPNDYTHTPVHPRARGEHDREPELHSERMGSSPRTRGTPKLRHPAHTRTRFIPAHAGNTRRAVRTTARETGSSPRTRGTQCRSGYCRPLKSRFIPAHAGNTSASGNFA